MPRIEKVTTAYAIVTELVEMRGIEPIISQLNTKYINIRVAFCVAFQLFFIIRIIIHRIFKPMNNVHEKLWNRRTELRQILKN